MVGHIWALRSVVLCSALLANALIAPAYDNPLGQPLRVSHDELGNMSLSTPPEEICRCCWRDCEHDSEQERGKERIQVSGSSRLRIQGADDVDAWLLMAHGQQQLERNMYTPILETVRYGLRNVAKDVRVIDTNSLQAMLDGISGAAAKGKRPLVMAVAWFWSSLPDIQDRLRDASDRGAYLVLYQTESATYTDYGSQTAKIANAIKAHEIWDYALANVNNLQKGSQIPVRFIPPGYAPGLDVGVDVNSPHRDETKVGYMGMTEKTEKPMYPKYAEQLGAALHTTNSIWTRGDLKAFLETYPVQLSMHKFQTCCPREAQERVNMHMESFRFAELLSNKACVISPPGSDADTHMWASSIHIAEVENTHAEFEKIEASVRNCQEETFRRFTADFDAERLLAKSGFLSVWSPR